MDISTSDALQMALEIDPKGDRTIGVLTKVDIMDRGTNCKKILHNEEIPLKNGYVALKNRSQQDIINGMSIQDALKQEKEFFQMSPIYRSLGSEHFGTEVLIEKLRRLFFENLKKFLPKIYSDLKMKIKECQDLLETFGTDYLLYTTSTSSGAYITSLVNQFSDTIERLFSSKMVKIEDNVTNHKIKELANSFLSEFKTRQPSDKMNNKEIINILKVTEGIDISGYPRSEVIFELLKQEIDELRIKLKEYLEEVYLLSTSKVKDIMGKIFCRFPNLLDKIEELVNSFFDSVRVFVNDLAI
jgi:hypothetical protein